MRNLRMFFALLAFSLGVLWGGVEQVQAQTTNPIQPSTWGGIKAMYGEQASATSPTNSGQSDVPVSADYINELGRQEADKLVKSGRHQTNGAWVLYISVPFYSQRDLNWAYYPLLGYGKCGSSDNIYNYGCHLCCISMLYAKWGYPQMNPPGLNNWTYNGAAHYAFDPSGCGDLIRPYEALQYPGVCRYRYLSGA